jgi:hypothetical protein
MFIQWIVEGVHGDASNGYQSALASNRYRAIVPAMGLEKQGHRVEFNSARNWVPGLWQAGSAPDAIVIGKLLPSKDPSDFNHTSDILIGGVLEAHRLGIPVLADINDDHFEHPVLGRHWRGIVNAVDGVIAGSEVMADIIKQHTDKPVLVIGDPVAAPYSEAAVYRRESGWRGGLLSILNSLGVLKSRLQLIWYGSPTNWASMATWADRLTPLASEQPFLLRVITQPGYGAEEFVERFNFKNQPGSLMEFIPWEEDSVWDYVQQAHIVLIPSDLSDKRKSVKTANRLADALISGRFVVASPVPAYQEFHEAAWLGDDLLQGIRWCVANPQDALEKIYRGQNLAIKNYAIDNIARQWAEGIESIVAKLTDSSRNHPVEAPIPLYSQAGTIAIYSATEEIADCDQTTKTEMLSPSKEPLINIHNSKSGKVSDKWEAYFPIYERLFTPIREENISILEIGVQNGGSLEVWGGYFGKATKIVGCDIEPMCGKLNYSDSRIKVVVGDANLEPTKASILMHSKDFDIIIDDGSHISKDIVASFISYFPVLNPGGLYVIEDTHALYRRVQGGGVLCKNSAYEFFKLCIELTNIECWQAELSPQTMFTTFIPSGFPPWMGDRLIESIEFTTSMIIIRKSKAKSGLGRRIVAGHEASVFPGVLRHKTS